MANNFYQTKVPSTLQEFRLRRAAYGALVYLGVVLLPSAYAVTPDSLSEAGRGTIRTEEAQSKIRSSQSSFQISSDIERQIATYFEQNQCDKINALIPVTQFTAGVSQMRPLLEAVIAACQPSDEIAEPMFYEAETRDRGNDLIYVLHARYHWMQGIKDPKERKHSEELWRRVLLVSRNPTFRRMARDYLSGAVSKQGNIEINLERPWELDASAQFGESYETNPSALGYSLPPSGGSFAKNLQLNLGAQRNLNFGSVAGNYSFTNNIYDSTPTDSYLAHNLEIPATIKIDTNADFIFRPFGTYSYLGDQRYQSIEGFGLMGWIFNQKYNQSIQGMIFKDQYGPVDLKPQQGAHYRLEYNYQFYPKEWYFRFMWSFEHVDADADNDPDDSSLITYSHNDISLQFYGEYTVKWITFGLSPRFYTRQDDNDSTYVATDGITQVTKRRQDYQFVIHPSVTLALSRYLRVIAWYEYNRTFSNLGSTDYVDDNILNQVGGIALRVLWANY